MKNDVLVGGSLPLPATPRLGWASRRLFLGLLATYPGAASSRFRGLRWSGALLALSGVLGMGVLASVGAADVADVLALRLLAYASWLYGAVGLSALIAPRLGTAPTSRISGLRGHGTDAASTVWVGIALRIAAGVFLSGLPGVLTALLLAPPQLWWLRLLLVPASFAYALGLGASLGAIGALSQSLAPKRPRTLAALLILLPYALSLAWPQVPSIPGFFGLVLDQLLALGGARTL